MVTEEINMNEVLEEEGCEVTETDLGEYILQIDDHDPPSHIVAPALHKNKEQIRDVFKERLEYKQTEKPEELVMHARRSPEKISRSGCRHYRSQLCNRGYRIGQSRDERRKRPPCVRAAEDADHRDGNGADRSVIF